ncbi:MAG: DUF2480 family protein [Flavobacteriaceae bacterium]|nr:DUF2480 family protein [Flavobacteriaceae bacterium]
MSGEILNRVSKSKLITLDLEDFYPSGNRVLFDIAPWLYQKLILKEKEFRISVDKHQWEQYAQCYVALSCSVEAIIPSWAYLLLSSKLAPYAKKVVVGNLDLLETTIFSEIIDNLDISQYKDKPIIIKGCANKPIPNSAYTVLVKKLQPAVKSIMYGEACSTVPIYKKK